MQVTDLSEYNNDWYNPGAGLFKRGLWYCVNACFFVSYFPFSGIKVTLLRLFGATVVKGVVIKPAVNVKYPWKLKIGDHVWIGERVWIDNLDNVIIGNHSCLSQGAMILCGNHNYKKRTFDLITAPVALEEGVWLGAKSLVCPGVVCYAHSVLAAGAVANKNLESYSIYQGVPAKLVKERIIE